MTKPRATQRKTACERSADASKHRERKAVARAARKAQRASQPSTETDTEKRAAPMHIVRRSSRPPSYAIQKMASIQRAGPTLPNGEQPISRSAAELVIANFYREGSYDRPATMPGETFTAEGLAQADLWARRIIGDFSNQKQGLRSMYPSLDEWPGDPMDAPHVSGKTLGECTLGDLCIASLAYRMAVEHVAALEEAA